MKTTLMILALSCWAAAASGAVWTHTLDDPDTLAVIPVDIDVPIESLQAVIVHVVGFSEGDTYICWDWTDYFEVQLPNYFEGTFGQDGPQDDMMMIYSDPDGMGVDVNTICYLDVTDTDAWTFLSEGSAAFTLHYWMGQFFSDYHCSYSPGEYRIDSVTLTIIYNEAVAHETTNWGTIKARYR